MDDLISRQEAIDALCKMRCGCGQYSCQLTLEKFFRGDQFRLFTHGQIDPEYLIQKLRQKARKKHKKGDGNI